MFDVQKKPAAYHAWQKPLGWNQGLRCMREAGIVSNQTLEMRWIILATDGRHVTIGRHTDPSESEVQRAGIALAAAGQAGWLAIMKGGYYERLRKPSLMMVRPLGNPQRSWDEAAEFFEHARRACIADAG